MLIRVFCLDEGRGYYFSAKTPYEAMENMKYTLDLKHLDKKAEIKQTDSGTCLFMDHSGKTYSVINRR